MRTLSIAGQVVPAIGIGTWHMGDHPQNRAEEIAAIQAGVHAGARVVDTAEMYGSGRSESLVGAAIQPFNRTDLFLISKVLPQNASASRMRLSLEASLRRLKTDYLDLYLYHWRGNIPLAETVRALEDLQQAGLIRSWGVSNFDEADLKELWQVPNGHHVQANEDLYHLGSRGIEYAVLPWQQAHNVPLIAYSPIAQGDSHGQGIATNATVKAIAAAHQVSVYQVLLAWVIRQPQTLAIPQTNSVAHMRQNVAAANLDLTSAELGALDEQYPRPTQKEPLDVI